MGKTRGQFRIYPSSNPGVQIVEAATNHTFPRHSHEQYGIGVIHQGAQKSHSGRGMVEAGPGHVITVNPGEVHDGVPIGDAGRSWRMLYFDPHIVDDAVRDMNGGKGDGEFTQPVMNDATIAKRFQHLFASMLLRPGPSPIDGEEQLLRLLAHVHGRRTFPAPLPAAIRVVKERIDDEPTASITLESLARASGLSRFQVLRGFAGATGFTPQAYLMQRRTDLARRLIADGTGLAEVAAASGFADQSHMTRIFVRKYGISPGTYAAALA